MLQSNPMKREREPGASILSAALDVPISGAPGFGTWLGSLAALCPPR